MKRKASTTLRARRSRRGPKVGGREGSATLPVPAGVTARSITASAPGSGAAGRGVVNGTEIDS